METQFEVLSGNEMYTGVTIDNGENIKACYIGSTELFLSICKLDKDRFQKFLGLDAFKRSYNPWRGVENKGDTIISINFGTLDRNNMDIEVFFRHSIGVKMTESNNAAALLALFKKFDELLSKSGNGFTSNWD